jgi:hypothetical protein
VITPRTTIAAELVRVASESPSMPEAEVCQVVADRLHLSVEEVADILAQAKQEQQRKAA